MLRSVTQSVVQKRRGNVHAVAASVPEQLRLFEHKWHTKNIHEYNLSSLPSHAGFGKTRHSMMTHAGFGKTVAGMNPIRSNHVKMHDTGGSAYAYVGRHSGSGNQPHRKHTGPRPIVHFQEKSPIYHEETGSRVYPTGLHRGQGKEEEEELPPGYHLRKKYGTVGAGYTRVGSATEAQGAVGLSKRRVSHAVATHLMKKVLQPYVRKLGLLKHYKVHGKKKLQKLHTHVHKKLSRSIGVKNYTTAITPLVATWMKFKHGHTNKLAKLSGALGQHLFHHAQHHVMGMQLGGRRRRKKPRFTHEDRVRRRAKRKAVWHKVVKFGKDFYNGFMKVAKPIAKIAAPLVGNIPVVGTALSYVAKGINAAPKSL